MSGKVFTKLEFFNASRVALNQELKHHPKLSALMSNYSADDFEGKIGEIAAHFNIILDGAYTQQDLDQLCDLLCRKLRDKRKVIIH